MSESARDPNSIKNLGKCADNAIRECGKLREEITTLTQRNEELEKVCKNIVKIWVDVGTMAQLDSGISDIEKLLEGK